MLTVRRLAWALCGAFVALAAYEALRPAAAKPEPSPRGSRIDEIIAGSREADRADGLTAQSIPPTSADKLSPPEPGPRKFGGAALDEQPRTESGPGNEVLHKDLEKQKARLGIRKIIPPDPRREKLLAALRGPALADEQPLETRPPPAPLGGTTPSLLSPGEPRVPADAPGRAVYSASELARLWRESSLAEPMPRVDFSRQMVVVVLGERSIARIDATEDRLIVRYRPGRSGRRWLVAPRRALPVAFVPAPAGS